MVSLRAGVVAGLLLACCAAGCGQPAGGTGVATAGGATATAGGDPQATAASDRDKMINFVQCMRDNGIDMPDPEFGTAGGTRMRMGEGEDPQKAEEARQTCKHHLPNGGEPPALDPAALEQLRKMSQCMRENGFPDFPDPEPSGGGIKLDAGPEMDPTSPEFKAAQEVCAVFRPTPPPGAAGPQLNSSSG